MRIGSFHIGFEARERGNDTIDSVSLSSRVDSGEFPIRSLVNPRGTIAQQIQAVRARRADEPAALSLPAVYRSVQLISNAIASLPLTVERAGRRLPWEQIPAIIRQPSLYQSRSEFIEALVVSMCLRGNAYFMAVGEINGAPAELQVLNPDLVGVDWDENQHQYIYEIDGKTYRNDQVGHCALLRPPGQLLGLSPIRAAAYELSGIIDTRNYATKYFDSTGQPTGILSADALTPEQAIAARNAWNGIGENGDPIDLTANPSRIRVLGNGLKYSPLGINPREAQWIEARQFDTSTIARLFGVPAHLLESAADGNSQTYSNNQDQFRNFNYWTLSMYTRKIEDELTRMTVRGQRVRFNLDARLRADTADRYQAYKTAIEAGFMTINEVRALEGMEPITATSETQGE